MTLPWKLVGFGVLFYLGCVCLFGGDAFAQRTARGRNLSLVQGQKEKPGAKQLDEIYYGVSSCANKGCHGGDRPERWVMNPRTKKPFDLLVKCDEAAIWKEKDKHSEAYNVLVREGGLGKRMEAILAKVPENEKAAKDTGKPYRVTEDPACLACHAVVIKDKKLIEDSEAVGFDIKEGVSCVACHGNRADWVAQHSIAVTAYKFRPLPRKIKQEVYGMRDLSSPLTQAELCASCHIGNMREGKFVTHEMYAAGHPPLPGFEAASFAQQEPRHWELRRDKKESIQEELGFAKGTQEETHLMLVGAVVAFRDSMALLEDQSKATLAKKAANDRMLDLSNYDCWACHHDLKKKAWQQDPRRFADKKKKPGRVPMRSWSVDLVRLSVKYLEMKDKGGKLDEELTAGLKELSEAFEVGVGGDVAKIEKASSKLVKWSGSLAEKVNGTAPTADDVKKLLPLLPELYAKEPLGYDSARQVGWAAEVMFNELNRNDSGPTEARTVLGEIRKTLKLRFPEGKGKFVEDGLKESLEAINEYEGNDFRLRLEGFGKALKK